MKENLKPYAYEQWEGGDPAVGWICLTACLLHNEPASCSMRRGGAERRSRSESESEEGVESHGADPKPSELSMARVKRR